MKQIFIKATQVLLLIIASPFLLITFGICGLITAFNQLNEDENEEDFKDMCH